MNPARIAVVGSLNMDLVWQVRALPQPGETVAARAFGHVPGGKGANQAVAAARMGARVAMVGRVGADAFGEQLRAGLAGQGIDVQHLRTSSGLPTGVAGIQVDERGRNCIVVAAGANAALRGADIDAAAPTLRACDVLLCQLEVPLATVAHAIGAAAAAGVRTLLNPSPFQPLPAPLLRSVTGLLLNEVEAAELCGGPVADVAGALRAARQLLALGPALVLVTLGERGVCVAQAGGAVHLPAVPVTAVDTTAAGDTFAGAFATCWAEGAEPVEAARQAQFAAALAVTRAGAQPSIPHRAEVEAFARQQAAWPSRPAAAAAPAAEPRLSLTGFMQALPKAELHCHLLGTVRRATFTELAQRYRAPLSAHDIEAFYTRGDKPVGVLRVLRALDAHLLKTPDDLHRITFEYLQDAAAHQVRYAEFSWNPTGTARDSGIPYARAQQAIVRAIADAQADLGVIGRLIPAIDREASPAEALQVVRWMTEHRCDEVVGLGIDYREVDRPPELFVEAFAAARRAGFRATAHAGEFGMPWTHVRTALRQLEVDRIDHGYTVIDEPAFARECAERGVVFTVVPTNSYYLRTLAPERWALDHPIRKMPALGLRIHPNTDDPTLHHVTPTKAWLMMVRDFGFGLDDLRGFMHNGLDAAWIDDGARARWRRDWTAEFDALRARVAEPPPAAP